MPRKLTQFNCGAGFPACTGAVFNVARVSNPWTDQAVQPVPVLVWKNQLALPSIFSQASEGCSRYETWCSHTNAVSCHLSSTSTAWKSVPRKSRAAAPGFTLLELLVALVISGILAFSLFSSLYIAFKAQENSKADVAPVGSIDMAWDLIRADIQAAQPPNGVLEGPFEGTQTGSGSGETDTLDFYTNGYAPPHQTGNGEIKHVILTLEQRSDGNCLVRQVVPNLLSQQTPVPDEEVICRNVTTFALQYFDGEQWQTSWDSTQYNNALPAAVEVILEFVPPGAADPRQTVHMRRVFALSCVSQQTTATGAASSSGTGSGSGNGGNTGNSGGNTRGGGGGGGAGGGGGGGGGARGGGGG
jgi:type II secretion system protein J